MSGKDDTMSRLILRNGTTSEMNRIAPFREIEFTDEGCIEGVLVTVTLQDGSKQYGFLKLRFQTDLILIRGHTV
jgi:hypothetical protein